jgi:uncharacterized membrane protein YsdA (DUF1294 family)
MMPLIALALYLVAINVTAFAAFGIDKRRAARGQRRIAEKDLLLLAVIGGTVGAYLGRQRFRHKTRKPEFSMMLHLLALMQVSMLGWLTFQRNFGL